MKRLTVLLLCFFAVSVFAEDTFKVFLKDGKIAVSDTKPEIRGDRVYFERFGMMLYILAEKVDIAKTERGGDDDTALVSQPAEKKKAKKAVAVTDDELNKIKGKARLANEDEIRALEYVPAEGEAGAASEGGVEGVKIGTSPELQQKLGGLMDQRSQLQGNVNDLMQELSSKKDQFGFATMATDKQRLESEISETESRLSEARSRLSSVDNQITATQQEIASTPVVIETPGQNQPASAPPVTAAAENE